MTWRNPRKTADGEQTSWETMVSVSGNPCFLNLVWWRYVICQGQVRALHKEYSLLRKLLVWQVWPVGKTALIRQWRQKQGQNHKHSHPYPYRTNQPAAQINRTGCLQPRAQVRGQETDAWGLDGSDNGKTSQSWWFIIHFPSFSLWNWL